MCYIGVPTLKLIQAARTKISTTALLLLDTAGIAG